MPTRVTQEDRGKELVFQTSRVGVVTDVEGDDVFVDPDFDRLPSDLRATFDWDPTDDHYVLSQQVITDISNGKVRLRDDLVRV